MRNTKRRITLMIAIIVAVLAGGVAYVMSLRAAPWDIATGALLSAIPSSPKSAAEGIEAVQQLSPSAAGDDVPAAGPREAQGVVDGIYVRVAQGMLVEYKVATAQQRGGWKYASIEFPEPMADGTTKTLALSAGGPEFEMGDVVEMRFADKGVRNQALNPFRMLEHDRVTRLVAKSGTQTAQDFQRRITALSAGDASQTQTASPELWKSLPLDSAVKVVHGAGKNEIAIFSDPNCLACRAFENTLQQADDLTVYVFLTPVIRPDRAFQSRSIWCSADRAQAWLEFTLRQRSPGAVPNCVNPVEANVALSQKAGIRATPTIVFANGQRMQGNIPIGVLRERIAQVEAKKVSAAP